MNILDNIGRKVADTCKTAAKASGELLEETKLRIAIATEQSKVDELYEKLGSKVYKLYDKGELSNPEFEIECGEITSIKEKVETMREKLRELRNIKTCPNCKDEIEMSFQYCPICGTKQEISEEQ